MKILVINGVNLNMLGVREPQIYGAKTYRDLVAHVKAGAKKSGVRARCFQSNYEGAIVGKIQRAARWADGIIINAGAYTHTSVAILDALKAVQIPTVEVHISDVNSREDFRRFSYISLYAEKVIAGKGFDGYTEAIEYLAAKK